MRAAYLSTLVAILGLAFTASADAAVYKGSTDSRDGRASGDVALTVMDGRVTAFSAGYHPVCDGGLSTSGQLSLNGSAVPVAADGSATFGVRGTLFGSSDAVAGTVTIRNALPDSPAVSGIVSGSGLLIGSAQCSMQRDFLAALDVEDVRPDKTQFISDAGSTQVEFDRVANTLHRLYLAGGFFCPGGGNFGWYAPARGVQRVKLSKYGTFTVEGYDTLLGFGDAVRFTIKGRVTKRGASGTITIDARSFGRDDECASIVQQWSSILIRPVVAGPEVSAELFALRRIAGAGYRYGIGIGDASCAGGATHIKTKVAGRSRTTSCAVARRRTVAVVMGLRPGASYTLRLRAVRLRRGRAIRSSPTSTSSVAIPQPGSPEWERNTGRRKGSHLSPQGVARYPRRR